MSDSDRDNDIESDLDKRAHHNAQERERRDHIEESFNNLRDAIPGLKGQKISRTQICLKASEYVEKTVKLNAKIARECGEIQQNNEIWEDKIRELAEEKGLDPEAVLDADFETFKAMVLRNRSEKS